MAAGIATSFGLFFLLRLFDEFKDAEDDAKYRPYSAVPRGLVSIGELRALILGVIAFMVAANTCIAPALLAPLALSIGYLLLMWREFFVPTWLRRHPVVYMLSHMMVMPLIDFYTSGLDWIVRGFHLPAGMLLFLALTFTNGCIIEIGRKIRVPEDEEPGVETYSALWGPRRAAAVWLVILVATAALALACCARVGCARPALPLLAVLAAFCAAPAALFLRGRHCGPKIELASGVWTLAMYLVVGGLPALLGPGVHA
jgi:4-hydroxybenzoate polyprenyltransferase